MSPVRLLVVGDTLLDRDVDGEVTRIAPDAPAPVLEERRSRERPGGAGLAAMLAAADGHDVTLVTALADDDAAVRLTALLTAAGVRVLGLAAAGATAEKIRLRAAGQVLMRLDRGGRPGGPPAAPCPAALAAVRDADAILVSDYGRGVTGEPALRGALADSRAPVVWDPHPRGGAAVPGTTLLTPNLRELEVLTGIPPRELGALIQAGQALQHRWRAAAVAVTRGAEGVLLVQGTPTPHFVPAPERLDGDTCGAGDQFAVATALALGAGQPVPAAVEAGVARATAYLGSGGPAGLHAPADTPAEPAPGGPRTEAEQVVARIRRAGGTVVATGGCFDLLHAGHVATLRAARALGDCLIVCLNSDRSVRALKGEGRPVVGEADRARLLSALDCVDGVMVFDELNPEALLSWLRPDVWVKGGDYGTPDRLPEYGLVRGWGGQVVIVPQLDGHSTTNLIQRAATGGRGRTEKTEVPA
ncbi:MAG TPA: PfkB family carbohydrate kinase [Pilimelia sp.]|nr:PfkB family carbohydrate kinase [Pilimelia sp.]